MKVKIKSKDMYGEEFSGIYSVIKLNILKNLTEYSYNDEYGKNKIIKYNDYIEIYRHGIINTKQVFKENETTTFTYITKEFKGKYNIFTKKIIINNEKISIKYDIIDKSEIFNKIDLYIEIIE